jgi:hypothetical protein
MLRLCSTVRAGLRFVQRPHSKRTNVTGSVVAWRNCSVLDRRSANEADLCIIIVVVVGLGGCDWLRDCGKEFALLVRLYCWCFAFVRCPPATARPTFSASPAASSTTSLRSASAPSSRPKLLVSLFLTALSSSPASTTLTSSALRACRRLRIFLRSSCASRSHSGVSNWVVWWYKSEGSREMKGGVIREVLVTRQASNRGPASPLNSAWALVKGV